LGEVNFTLGSLFAGIGGIDLGFERAGFKTAWQVEIDPYCRKVLKLHFPGAERYEDVRTVGVGSLRRVDVVAGGFPCQDISNAGDRAGIDGERSGLWREMARIIRELRPRFVLVENVAALLTPTHRDGWIEPAGIARVLGDLASIGYDAEWEVISAEDIGAPHVRERVWIVAYPQGERREEAGKLRCDEPSQRIRGSSQADFSPDIRKERVQRFFTQKIRWVEAFSWCKDVRRVEDLRGRSDIPEPLFRGASDGVPDWVDRIADIGNSVVPQIPEMIALRMKEFLIEVAA
jgi:DNA (cytosine-5)-methyltransferase 1